MRNYHLTLLCCLLFCFKMVGQTNLTEAEYFIDIDPGVGNASALSISSASSLNTSFAIPLNSVAIGIHTLHVRVKNNLNKWSLYARQVFYKSPQIIGNNIVAAEYFIDEDPGVGNAPVLSITSASSLNTPFAIPLTAVSEGIHILHIRVKNNLNQWSLYARQLFYKSPQILGNGLIAAEYFIDTDPGIGNGTTLAITQGANVDELLNVAIPSDLPDGDHILHIRVKSSNGNWSLYGRPEFTTTTSLSINDKVLKDLKIYPNPVEEVLHFSIQNNTIEKLSLIDGNGRVILEKTDRVEQVNLSHLPSGLYLLHIKTENGSISKKIIKK